MATNREMALEIALISVIAAAQRSGVELKPLIDQAAELVFGFPIQDPDRSSRIAGACTEISNAHLAVLTGERKK